MHVEQPRRSSRDKPALKKGQHVRATFAVDSKPTWFYGIVMDVGADSTFEVRFEDGEIDRLRANQLTIVNRAEEGVAMEEAAVTEEAAAWVEAAVAEESAAEEEAAEAKNSREKQPRRRRTAADVEQPQLSYSRLHLGAVSCIPECIGRHPDTFEIAQRRLRYELAAAAAAASGAAALNLNTTAITAPLASLTLSLRIEVSSPGMSYVHRGYWRPHKSLLSPDLLAREQALSRAKAFWCNLAARALVEAYGAGSVRAFAVLLPILAHCPSTNTWRRFSTVRSLKR